MKVDPKKLELHLARACMSEVDLRNGTSPQTLLRIRRGMEVKPKTVGKIALALGVDVIDIIENTQNQQNQDEVLENTGKGACESADFGRSWGNHIQQ